MKRIRAIASILVLPLAPLAAGSDVIFGAKPLDEGRKVSVSLTTTLDLKVEVTMHGQKMPTRMGGSDSITCVASATSADAQGPKSGKLVFGESVEVKTEPGSRPRKRTLDFSSRSYDVTRGEDGLVVKSERGALTHDEEETTSWIVATTIDVSPLGSFLAGRRMKPGESIDLPDKVCTNLLGVMTGGAKVSGMKLTLSSRTKERGADVDLFKVTAKIVRSHEDDEVDESAYLAGELAIVETSGLVLSLKLGGVMTITGSSGQGDQEMDFEGKGDFALDYTARVE